MRVHRYLPAVIIGAVLLAGCGQAPSPRPSPQPPTSSGAAVSIWTAIDLEVDDDQVGAVTVTATGFVMAGSSGDGGAAWTSTDGETWRAEALAGPRPRVGDIAGLGERALILADADIGQPCARGSGLAIWLGDGAGSWTEAPKEEAFCDNVALRILVSGNSILALASNRGDRPTAFLSNTAIRWLDVGAAFPAGPIESGVTIPAGFLVFGTGPQVLWWQRSTDGESWTSPAPLPVAEGSSVAGAGLVPGGVAAIVREPTGQVRVLGSSDGASWTPALAQGLAADALIRVESTPFGLVAIGAQADGSPALWTSADGTAWVPVAIPAEMNAESVIADVAVGHGLAILVGGASTPDGSVLAWSAPEAILAP